MNSFFFIVLVLDVLLNFAAATFVADLDEAAFFLAQKGFFGPRHRELSKVISRIADGEYNEEKEDNQDQKAKPSSNRVSIGLQSADPNLMHRPASASNPSKGDRISMQDANADERVTKKAEIGHGDLPVEPIANATQTPPSDDTMR